LVEKGGGERRVTGRNSGGTAGIGGVIFAPNARARYREVQAPHARPWARDQRLAILSEQLTRSQRNRKTASKRPIVSGVV